MRYYKARERNGRNATPIIRGSIDGEDHEFSTEARSKKEAQAEWDEYKARVRASNQSVCVPETFEELAKMYLAAKGDPQKTTAYLKRLYPIHLEHRGCRLGEMPADRVTSMDASMAAHSAYRGCKASTKNRNAIAPIASVLHFGAANDVIPYVVVEKLEEDAPEPRRPAEDVPGTLLANTDGIKRLLLLFLFCQGSRITETLSLEWERVNLTTRTAEIHISKSNTWKTIPLHEDVFIALANADKAGCHVFPWRTRSGVYKWLRPLCKRLGVRFTPHMARHEFGSGLGERSATSRDLVDVGTWTSEKSVQRYVNPSEAHRREVINRVQFREKSREGGSK